MISNAFLVVGEMQLPKATSILDDWPKQIRIQKCVLDERHVRHNHSDPGGRISAYHVI